MASSHTRILLTGFEPFANEMVNPSQQIILQVAPAFQCDAFILPVSYARSVEILKRHLLVSSYDYILMFGQAGQRSMISLERLAVNQIKATLPDEDGIQSEEKKIFEAGPDFYRSTLPLEEWRDFFLSKSLPVEISDSAGEFVCNHLYYQIMSDIELRQVSTKALFIHVPFLPEQTLDKPPGTPSLNLETMITFTETLMKKLQSS